MSVHPRFADFTAACSEALGLPLPTLEADSHMFQVGDRWIELRYHAADDRLTLAALVVVAPPEAATRADLVAAFNVQYLFNGGLTLVEPDEGMLYLCRPHQLAAVEPRDIRGILLDFAETAAMAGTWYLRTSDERPLPAPSSSAALPEGGEFFLKL